MITDPENPKSLRVFFETYGHLKSTDLAILANTDMATIRRWRERCNYKPENHGWGTDHAKRPFSGTSPKKVEVEKVPPEVWANPEWLRQKYEEGYGIRLIARMVNRNIRTVYDRMRKLGITRRDKRVVAQSKNSFCNRDWLIEHYEILGLSITKCAKLANVNRYTIYNWLVKHRIYIRDKHEALSGERHPFYNKSKVKLDDRIDTTKVGSNQNNPIPTE